MNEKTTASEQWGWPSVSYGALPSWWLWCLPEWGSYQVPPPL